MSETGSELHAVRASLLIVFCALPMGALSVVAQETERTKRPKKSAVKEEQRNENVTEAVGWNEELEVSLGLR